MKKLLPFFSVAFLFAACNQTPKTGTTATAASPVQQVVSASQDTAGLSEFQQWKIQNELSRAEDFKNPQPPVMVAPEKVKKQRPIYRQPQIREDVPSPVTATAPSMPQTTTDSSAATSNGGGTISSESSETAKAEEKKGISKSAKGAVIGGVVGAGAGAVINKKNPVIGAVIGGVIGAGGGYVIGKKMDKKDGRK